MPRVGPYGIPFPYDPYPLQEHAMTALRSFLEETSAAAPTRKHHHKTELTSVLDKSPIKEKEEVEDGSSNRRTSVASPSSPPSQPNTSTTIAVLESPTGTGKSHMLLNSVLSHLFTPIDNNGKSCHSIAEHADTTLQHDRDPSPPPAQQQLTTATTTAQAPTLESVLKQRQMEEEVDRIRHERKARVRARRRQLRRARKLMQLQQRQQQQQQLSSSSMAHAEGNDDFLISQDPLLWLKEHEPARPLYSSSDSSSSFSSSSSSSSSQHSGADCGSDDDNNEDDAESAIEGSLATLLPLRKPKVYIASRTHTQLEQLMSDLKQTAFSTHPLRARQQHRQASLPVELSQSSAAAATPAGRGASSSPRRLTAVHVAGRQHLCINRRILQKSGGGEMLNHYCREAMQYERSAEGRKARRRRQQRAQQAGISPLAFTENSIAAAMENETPSLLSHHAMGREMADMEDWGVGRSMGSTTPTLGGRDVGASAKATHDAYSRSKNDREADDGDGRTGEEEEDRGCAYCAESHLRALLDFLRAEQREQQHSDAATPPSLAKEQKTASASIYTMDRLRHLGQALRACPYIATRLLLRSADVAFIPYSYLLDEGQRSVLLGGVTTNPATAAEAAAAGMSDMLDEGEMEHRSASAYNSKGDNDDDDDERQAGGEGITKGDSSTAKLYGQVGGVSLGTVLYHRRQRVTAAAAFRRKRQQQQQQWSNKRSLRGREGDGDVYGVGNSPLEHSTEVTSPRKGWIMAKNGEKSNEEDDDDDVWGVAARAAPPSFRHDILVFDEAHNIADHCRAISTVSLLLWQLRLVEHLFQCYLARYESRLLTRNKQRLRELIRFLGKLIRFCERQPPSSTATSSVWPFHTFLFEAGIDSVDVYALLLFLVDTQLLMKLQGFMGYCLDMERRELEKRSAADAANGSAGVVKRQRTLLFADARGGKRVRTASSGAHDVLREQRQQQRQFLASLDAADDVNEEHRSVPEKVMAAETASCADGVDGGTPPLFLSSLLRQHATPHSACMDAARQRAIAAECLQRLERLLCMLHVSDAVSTRVLWTQGEAGKNDKGSSSGGGSGGGDTADVDGGVLRLIQLEPGQHTFASLVREAKAVVLAGGTMQPLALTCGPLLPLAALVAGDAKGSGSRVTYPRDEERRGGRNSHDGAASQPPSPALPVRLISEGHVVPPSSVRVFTLGTGPSHVRMEFTQQQLMGLSTTTSTTTTTASASRPGSGATTVLPTGGSPLARMMSELGCTLLNFARVLPPAGVICFFTSYDAMERIVAALQSCGYYQQINEIKRIFQETRGGAVGKMTRTKKDAALTSAREHDLSIAVRAVKETSNSLPGGSGFDEEREESFAKGESGHAGDVLQAYQDWVYGATTPATTSSSCSTSTQPAMRRGAMLFAVMGGRLSEGINFADDLGRAVIVIGMPYANPTDVELQLNLRHIATTRLGVEETDGEHRSTGNMTSSGSFFSHAADKGQSNAASLSSALASSTTSSTPFASAAEWGLYMDGMMRTVNQCIGRCIRHKDDYAVIILLDARYGERADVRRRVSAWLHPSLRVTKLFGECFAGVREFFAERKTVTESK